MAGTPQPLDEKFQIVGPDGRPTLYFIKWAQQRQIDISSGITLQDLIDYLTAHKLIEGVGIQLTNSGDINQGVTIAADVQEILDTLSATRGAIIYRGLLGWTVLLPGTAGFFLKTNGVGADPTWAAGGGGSTPWDFLPPTAASFTLLSGDATNLTLTDDTDAGLLSLYGPSIASFVYRTGYKTLSNKTLDWTLAARIRRIHENRNYRSEGLFIMDSISGRLTSFELRNDTGVAVFNYNNLTGSFSSTVYGNQLHVGENWEWQRIRHTGGNYIFELSAEGKLWFDVATVGDTSFLTNRADRVGFIGFGLNAGGPPLGWSIPYWSLTGPGV